MGALWSKGVKILVSPLPTVPRFEPFPGYGGICFEVCGITPSGSGKVRRQRGGSVTPSGSGLLMKILFCL